MKPHRRQRCPNFAQAEHDARAAALGPATLDPFLAGAPSRPIIRGGELVTRIAGFRGWPAGMRDWQGRGAWLRTPAAAGTGLPDGHRQTPLTRAQVGIGAAALLAATTLALLAGGAAPAATMPKPSLVVARPDDTPTGLLALQADAYARSGRVGPVIEGGWINGTFQ